MDVFLEQVHIARGGGTGVSLLSRNHLDIWVQWRFIVCMNTEVPLIVRVAQLALRSARPCMATYGSLKSRHDFTLPQLTACLVLKAYTKSTYRQTCELLSTSPALREAIGLDKTPHFTTLQKQANTAGMAEVIGTIVGQVLAEIGAAAEAEDLAIDSTGMQIGSASLHYRARSGKGASRYVKVSLAVICGLLLPAAMTVSFGPDVDIREMPHLLEQARSRVKPRAAYADRGYDAEWVHEYCWEDWGVESWIPPVIRTRDGSIKTPHRARMKNLPKSFGRRWHAETFMSGLKRSTGSMLMSRKENTLRVEAALRVLAYTIRR